MKLFGENSKFITVTTLLADLMWINVLTLVCMAPVFTIGAALTAKDYMCYKLLRNEENGLTKGYFKSFRQNFKQATVIWLFMLMILVFFVTDIVIIVAGGVERLMIAWVLAGLLFFLFVGTVMIFPVLSRFDNPVLVTVRNGVKMSAAIFTKAIVMATAYVMAVFFCIRFPGLIPLYIMFGISGPGYVSATLYQKEFEKLEESYYKEHPEEAPPVDPLE